MQPSEINSSSVECEIRLELQHVKYKLHLTLRFATQIKGTQYKICKVFKGKDVNDSDSPFFTEDFREGKFIYEDSDENDYLIEEKVFTINENSPMAMEMASNDVDKYIRSFCIKPDVEEVVVCILIPVLGETSIIPKIFLNSYPFETFQLSSSKGKINKINYKKSCIILYNFETITGGYISKGEASNHNKPITKHIVQLSVLMSYYIYFYIDMLEQKNWSFFRKDIVDLLRIQKYVTNKKTPQKSIAQKLWETLTNIHGVTINTIKGAFDFFCNYDGHLRNRVYNRIYDVLTIVYGQQSIDFFANKIFTLLSTYKEKGDKFSLYDFFELCGYWDYLNDDHLKTVCKKWDVMRNDGKPLYDTGWVSGYGAILFTDSEDYIYAFKGTDFDSYGRDWLATNVLQGLTGFSLQHHIASAKAKEYDKMIGRNGSLWFTGHSLGGGLASAATITTETREGITFNAAGLNVIGVKTKQLFKFNSQTLHPSQDWNRVTPYRIKGEVLDTAQKKARLAIPILERGYGKKSIDIEFAGKEINCAARHGINNFLYREVLFGLTTFEKSITCSKEDSNNKIVKAYFNGRDITMEGNLT